MSGPPVAGSAAYHNNDVAALLEIRQKAPVLLAGDIGLAQDRLLAGDALFEERVRVRQGGDLFGQPDIPVGKESHALNVQRARIERPPLPDGTPVSL